MPITHVEKLTNNSSKVITVFAPTLRISTYLVAFSVNNYSHVEATTDSGIKVRMFLMVISISEIPFLINIIK